MPAPGALGKRVDPKGARDKKKAKDAPAAPQDDVPPPPPMPGEEYAVPVREVVRPPNQLFLTDAELNEEVARSLTSNNPAAPHNIARFNPKERTFKFEPMVEQGVTHYATDGWLVHCSSDDAKRQLEAQRAEAEARARAEADAADAARAAAAGATSLEREAPEGAGVAAPGRPLLRNQFNFVDRAAQTVNGPPRERSTMTEPPPTAAASGSCSLWEVYDEYQRDFARQHAAEAARSKPGAKKAATPDDAAAGRAAGEGEDDAGGGGGAAGAEPPPSGGGSGGGGGDAIVALLGAASGEHSLRILDRMANQNTCLEVALDYKYWDDTSDAFRPHEGSLLPLWRFPCERGKKHVTSICWSPAYGDLFAVGYGSYHYLKQGGGAISLWSLKQPSHPERTYATDSGVMSVHFHPSHANLLVAGCHDGSVRVYDARLKGAAPLYQASARGGQHSDAVWQVCWQEDEMQKALQFVSVSTDGAVLLWTINQSELEHESIMRLRPPAGGGGGGGGGPGDGAATVVAGPSGGTCLSFNPAPGKEAEYLVGTCDGAIHRCSRAYGSDYLSSYTPPHSLAVYALRWNAWHPRLFLSAGADWTVRLWDAGAPGAPLLSWDLAAPVADVAWAPYSSTVFAAATEAGRVHVFDLAESRVAALCAQRVAKAGVRLTSLVFAPRGPLLLVGDARGAVSALKLSPNLRRCCKPAAGGGGGGDKAAAGQQGQGQRELELAKVEAVMAVAAKAAAAARKGAAVAGGVCGAGAAAGDGGAAAVAAGG